MERKFYSVYTAIRYSSEEHGDFFAVKNLLDTANNETFNIEKALYCHGLIQLRDLNQYCFVPGDHTYTENPNIIVFLDFYLVIKSTLEIIGKIKTYPDPNIGLNDFLILCEIDYAKKHGWVDE